MKESSNLDRATFENILLSFSELGDVEKVGQLLEDLQPQDISIEAVLNLRNSTLTYSPERTDIQDALEMRAIAMLCEFSKSKNSSIVLSNNHTRVA